MTIEQKQRLDRILGSWLLFLLRPLAQLAGRIFRRDHSTELGGEIVFIKILGGGSLLIALPALLGVRRRYPNHTITLVCGSPVASFAELIGIFDQIKVVNDRAGIVSLMASAAGILLGLIVRQVDTVIDLEVYSQLTTVFSLLTLARNRIGFYIESTYWRRNVLTHLVFFNRTRGVFHFYGAMARLIGAIPCDRNQVRAHLRSCVGSGKAQDDYVAVGAACSEFASVRLLLPSEWVAYIQSRGAHLQCKRWIFLGAAPDHAVSESVAAALRDSLGERFVFENRCGNTSLPDALACIAGARCFAGIDSALLHAARALGVPVVAFFGPTDPTTLLEPISGHTEEIYYRPPICSPCLHVTQSPPCKGHNVCMNLFTSDQVPLTPWCEDSLGRTVLPTDGY